MQSTVPSVNNKNKKRLPSFLVMLLMQAPKLVTPHLQNKYQAPSPTCSTSSHLHTIHIHTYHFTYHHHKMAQHRSPTETEGLKTILPEKSSPSTKSQILAAATGFPLAGFLLLLSGLTLSGTLIGLALATPLFIIFSPVLVPAALTLAMAVFGFLTTGVFGITALHALSWIVNYLRNFRLDQARQRVQDRAGQKTLTLHTI